MFLARENDFGGRDVGVRYTDVVTSRPSYSDVVMALIEITAVIGAKTDGNTNANSDTTLCVALVIVRTVDNS